MSLDFYLYKGKKCIYDKNITHNLGEMAEQAGIYKLLWRPEEQGYKRAKDITNDLKRGLYDLIDRPDYFKQFNSENGWGVYQNFLLFVIDVYQACLKHPNALIKVSR